MSPEQIEKVLLEVLKNVQELSGRKWEGLPVTGTPIGTLPGFDSLCSVEATVQVEVRLGVPPLGVASLFYADDKSKALTVQESAQRVVELLAKIGGKK